MMGLCRGLRWTSTLYSEILVLRRIGEAMKAVAGHNGLANGYNRRKGLIVASVDVVVPG
jgi:hypothetical protein